MFRTTEISNPEFESDNLRFITVKTPNLKGRGDICVFVPPKKNIDSLPIVILLHGVYGSSWVWSQKGGVHQSALKMIEAGDIPPMVIVMPSDGLWGDGSAYLPHNGKDFEKWIVEDVPAAVIENIEVATDKSPMFISGLSMGGFGALRLGIKYAENFKAISAHSAITGLTQMPLFVEEEISHYFQEDKNGDSILELAMTKRGRLPKIRFDCGIEDQLISYNRKLHDDFLKSDVEHIYEEFPGNHEWSYWQSHIKDSLLFFGRFC